MLRSRTVTLTIGGALLVTSVLVGVQSAREDARSAQRLAMTTDVAAQSAAIEQYTEKARTVLLLTARDPTLARLFHAAADAGATDRDRAPAHQALDYLRTLFPDAMGEACLLSADGAELARSVNGGSATRTDLSRDEADAPFFLPTLGLRPGQVHLTGPYLSSESHQWVVSFATPVSFTGTGIEALLQFELTTRSFLPASVASGGAVTVLDAATGATVLDSARPAAGPSPRGERPAPRVAGTRGVVTEGGQEIAYAKINSHSSLAGENNWYVLKTAPRADVRLDGSLAVSAGLLLLAGAFLIGFGMLSVRTHQRSLRHAAERDSLTGLANRALFQRVLDHNLRQGRRTGSPFSLLLMDLVRFKDVNDTLGHAAGDSLLVEIGHRLQSELRNIDLVARLGGDEFAILLPGDGETAAAVARRVAEALSSPIILAGQPISPAFSIGIAGFPTDADDAAELLRRADIAMYDAKRDKVGHRHYAEERQASNARRMQLLSRLRIAVETGGIAVHYQPQQDLRTDRVVALEALARWTDPELGSIAPDEFIPLAEENGLIDLLTERVLDQSLATCRQWLRGGHDVSVAVNISARSLVGEHLVPTVARLLDRHDLAASRLRLEVTETALMLNSVAAQSTLHNLYDMGVLLSIDDYGTGYSSLAYLKELPVDELKIDRSFVTDLESDASNGHIVRSTIALAHNLGLTVVAEGVEDADTVLLLRKLGCDRIQGYHLARPMPAAQASASLDQAALAR